MDCRSCRCHPINEQLLPTNRGPAWKHTGPFGFYAPWNSKHYIEGAGAAAHHRHALRVVLADRSLYESNARLTTFIMMIDMIADEVTRSQNQLFLHCCSLQSF